ncbi:SMI1/KNR4 family protein [Vibrio gazogenes]|uniref:SMI1/KNR4 family protein n=1 Tax=Vibrio gazogenes TaxID=687 RepID=A0A1Z2SBM5_VIBGA|nr:SMI1/KNR4 family protein [Vibrio gazogenes]ASA54565.1 SMI1/KNR4 family protein [Vibrio gazogenes]
MENLSDIKNMLDGIWNEPLHSDLVTKKIDVSIYDELSSSIPDSSVLIKEVFPEDELLEIWNNYKPYLEEYSIFPFLGTLGEAVICIGYGSYNLGKIFYFDFDFGQFCLDNDSLNVFLSKLID